MKSSFTMKYSQHSTRQITEWAVYFFLTAEGLWSMNTWDKYRIKGNLQLIDPTEQSDERPNKGFIHCVCLRETDKAAQ